MGVDMIGDWARTARILANMDERLRRAYRRGLTRVGLYAERQLKMGMRDSAPGGKRYAPNHPFTVRQKGSSKPLIRHGDLLGAITHQTVDSATVFVGVKRFARSQGGEPTVNIAAIHELGNGQGGDLLIRVTQKMRAYLHRQGLHLKPTTQYIRIPRRPTFEPVMEAEQERFVEIFSQAVQQGVFGEA